MKPSEVLRAARAAIEKAERDHLINAVRSASPSANEYMAAIDALQFACDPPHGLSVTKWLRLGARTVDDVPALFDRAIAAEEEAGR